MTVLALQQTLEPARAPRPSPRPQAGVMVQRKSTFGGAALAPALRDAGVPLDAATRHDMERGFGADFSAVRIHDDAHAHDSARSLNARAYAAGNDLVFASGSYRPDSDSGRALIAHELAHAVQQGGVQRKADAPVSDSVDRELEFEADRAAMAVTSGGTAPTLSHIGRPALLRADDQQAAPGGRSTAAATQASVKLPPNMAAVIDEPKGLGTTMLVVEVRDFQLPVDKGAGKWVEDTYNAYAGGNRLSFEPLLNGSSVAAYKEGAGADYKDVWLRKYGFTTTAGLAAAFEEAAKTDDEVRKAMEDPEVAALIAGMKSGLKGAKTDVDHIVEKQLGGSSNADNLQLLVREKNRAAGSQTYQELVKLVDAIRDPNMRGPRVRKLRIDIKKVRVAPSTADASYIVESLLQRDRVKGSYEVKAAAGGKDVLLTAGGATAKSSIRDSGETPIDQLARRLVHGVTLTTYRRAGKRQPEDLVEAELDNAALRNTRTRASNSVIRLIARPGGATAAAASSQGAAAAVGETRRLSLDEKAKTAIGFYYPYLSPGVLTSLAMDDGGNVTGSGYITPTIPLFKRLEITYGPDRLALLAPVKASELKAPIPGFRFKEGQIALELAPNFVPSGNLTFEVGPQGKPILNGAVSVRLDGTALAATGELTPAGKIPGIEAAKGTIEYHSERGWSGKLVASTSSIPNATVNAELGFKSKGGVTQAYGAGGISTAIKGAQLMLGLDWNGQAVSYSGGVTVRDPLPLVNEVDLKGKYTEGVLRLTGRADIKWKSIGSTMVITYTQRDGEAGKFSGKAGVDIATEKAAGHMELSFNEAGQYSGKGSVAYQLTKTLRPKLEIDIDPKGRVKIGGEVKVGDIPLTKMWPGPNGAKKPIIKGVGVKFSIPTPVPGISAYGEIRGSLGVGYGVGPVVIKGVLFTGELYPLEEDPKVKAKLKGNLSVPAYGELYGTFGAFIGLEVLLGAAGAKGGIEVSPGLGVKGEGGVDFEADYDAGGFSFAAEAYAKGQMYAKLGIDLKAEIYAAWGVFSHEWTYPVASVSKQLGPELKVTLGRLAYSRTGEITWPDPSQIEISPKDIDPLAMIKELLSEGKAKEK